MLLSVRVYTSIDVRLGLSRSTGKDAIRVCVLWHRGERGEGEIVPIGREKRVHRVENWRENLQQRLDSWSTELLDPCCPRCGAPMRLIKPNTRGKQYDPFWSCVRFQRQGGGCTGTLKGD
jgi:hypothetical protein